MTTSDLSKTYEKQMMTKLLSSKNNLKKVCWLNETSGDNSWHNKQEQRELSCMSILYNVIMYNMHGQQLLT